MCGIVGYVGAQSALEMVLAGLRRLPHPDCGSAGVAVLADGGLATARAAGTPDDLAEALDRRPLPTGTTALGHLRRDGRGAPADRDALPRLDDAGRVAVVRDGAIDGWENPREEPAGSGHPLAAGTDTEDAARLLAQEFSSGAGPDEAMHRVCGPLTGRYVLAAVHAEDPDTLVAACRGLPLTVGRGDGEAFLASRPAALGPEALDVTEVLPPPDGGARVVVLRREDDEVRVEITDVAGTVVER
ncbi:glucosamine--fructose-6-phosphate aminotransferase [Streptomyces sodiiphilus]